MRSYVFISITALYFYTFLMLAFMSAKKSRLIRDFIAVLGAMILWTGGSLLMRLRAWPSYELWFHLSLAGISLVPCAFFCFIRDFCGHKAKGSHKMWLVLILLVNLYNIWTGSLVQPPAIEWNGASAVFVYHMDWRASIMYGLCFLVIIHTAAIIWSSRKNRALKAKVVPLLSGIFLLFAGNMAVPLFNGFPIDILSGVLNAGVMFYTLYSRHVFRMTLLVSRGNCYIIAMAVSALAFYNVAQTLDGIIRRDVPMLAPFSCLLLKDFRRTVEYKSMWEEEKYQMEVLKIECILPLKDGDDLAGLVLMGGKEKRGKMRAGGYSEEDIIFLNSIESVSSIAVKNSRLYEKAYEEARTDELTGLLNRKYFCETLEENYEKCKRTSLALVIFNVDDFKLYNQLYGNHEGDKALVHIARIIQGTVGDNGYCGRYSGKEFAVILPDYDIYSAQNLAENISRQIQNMNLDCTDTYSKPLTVSCGICAAPYAAASMNELISNADCAVYHVKRSGKNGIRVYSDGIIGVRDTDEGLAKKHRSMYSEYAPTIYALTAAIDAKDHYTFQHSKNVAYYAHAMGQALKTSEEYQEIFKESALLHDIGKIGIPENILNKTGKLTDEEYSTMKRHVEASVEIIRHLPSMDYVIPAVLGHHERYDGRGYPRRIAGKDIPLAARILCIADSFDAMVSKRSYKPSMSVEFAVNELERGAGTQFDPELVPVFIGLVKDGIIRPVLNEGNGVCGRELEGTDA